MSVSVGERIPSFITEAYRVRRAIGRVILTAFQGQPPGKQRDALLHRLAGSEGSKFRQDKWNWYITLDLQRKANIDDEAILPARYAWIEPATTIKLERDFAEYSRPHLDRIGAHVSLVVGCSYLCAVALEGVFFGAPDRIPFGLPVIQLPGVTVSFRRPAHALDTEALFGFLQEMARKPEKIQREFDLARKFHLAACGEQDKAEQFMSAMVGLEALAGQVWKKRKELMIEGGSAQDGDAVRDMFGQAPGERTQRGNPPGLTKRFAAMAKALHPATAAQDIDIFGRLHKFRSALVHPQSAAMGDAPASDAVQLLARYLSAALRAE
ncbi:MAG TPA: hypothetical protein VM031_01515 [Phycisphaerae bacterium]|nr:hypothetical protein [Phycisphaerae bacterium]